MRNLIRLALASALAAAVTFQFVRVADAADRQRDRKKDGTCQAAGIQQRDRDRRKDGSCGASGIQDRKRDRRKDGSCK